MATEEDTKARAKAIDEALIPIRSRLDQLVKQAEAEKLIKRETTEALIEELTTLQVLEEEALKLKRTRLVAAVRKERDRAREAMGLTVKRRR